MSKYANVWTNGDETVKSETRPVRGESRWFAVYATSRVSKRGYIPYEAGDGSPEWVADANRNMKDAARD